MRPLHPMFHRRPIPNLRRRAVALVIATAFLAMGCSSGGDDEVAADAADTVEPADTSPATTTVTTPQRSPGCDTDPADAGPRATHERVDITSGGTERWYSQLVPTAYEGEPTPLVVDLHGYLSGSGGQIAMSDLGRVAEQEGFVVATPQGNSDMPYWNAAPHADLPDDVTFVADVIDDVGERLCIDPHRVYVEGFSNGAFLTSLVACRLSDRVAAVAAVAGLLLPADCAPTRAVPMLAIHGTDDRFVSFTGGASPGLDELTWNEESTAAFDGLPWAEVTTTAAAWAELQECGPEPTRTPVGDAVELIEYTECSDDSAVQLYVVDGGGHAWPGSAFSTASEPILGMTTDEIDATEAIWSFFREHPLP